MNVLDHGEVILVDSMASDLKVVGAARVSTGSSPESASKGEGPDQKLISYLMKNGHGTPFEHAVFQWFVKAPIFVVREWQRHRMASYNERSGRYSEFEPEFYVPDHVRVQDPSNKQGAIKSSDHQLEVEGLFAITTYSQTLYEAYRNQLARGIAREMARMVLPINMYTAFWFTVNARSLMNFLALRNHSGAMWEIQQYAEVLEQDFAEAMPWTAAAFEANGRVAP